MKAPITQAQAWAVIAESAGWGEKELPVLPEPDVHGLHAFSESTLKAYGAACAAHAREMTLEEAKGACVGALTYHPDLGIVAANAIEALKKAGK